MSKEPAAPQISTAAARRRVAVERARRWHDQRRAERRPERREIDRAIAEAVCFVVNIETYSSRNAAPISVDLRSVVDVAKLVLREQGYAESGLRQLIVNRLQRRQEHDDRTRFVNRHGVDDPKTVGQPRRGGDAWTEKDAFLINRVVRRVSSPNT